MKHTITSFSETMSRLRHVAVRDQTEIEFWSAREIYPDLGYDEWRYFAEVIEKAKENCVKIGANPKQHFGDVTKMIEIGNGAHREQKDHILSREACYLIALNANANKEEIAWAKAYFIVQTLAVEMATPALTEAEERAKLRQKLVDANKSFAGAAKQAGVDNFGFFNAAGIRGLYGKNMSELKSHKGLSQKDDYWDRVCGLELSANEFKAQLAKKTIAEKTKRGELKGQKHAEQEHERVGQVVRETVRKEAGIYLENLPPEPSLKKLLSAQKKLDKAAAKRAAAVKLLPDSSIE